MGRWVKYPASILAVLSPCYLVERITNYYFLTSNPLFGAWSGWRIELFVVIVLLASVFVGALFRRLLPASICTTSGIATFLLLVYVFCDPHVCYSAGLDGLEPLRMGLFLSSEAIASASIGVYARTRKSPSGLQYVAVGFSTFVAVGYYPIIFTFAGTRLLVPFDPWSVDVLLFFLSFSVAATASERVGRLAGLVLPLATGAVVMLLSGAIAISYLSTVAWPALLMAAAITAGTLAATAATTRRAEWTHKHFVSSSKPLVILVILLLAMTVVEIPDAAVGLVPQQSAPPGSDYVMGVPVYAGGYMDAGLGRTEGVAIALSFAGTNVSTIQSGNFLAAGIGAHSPGCCVDGIDYGYRFDAYVFHDGSESLVASAWEVCDHNAACGGHSWKVLMYQHVSDLASPNLTALVHLAIRWRGHDVYWSYSIGGGVARNLTSFSPPAVENPYFNTGFLPGGLEKAQESGYYFFQFGVFSRYPVEGGWSVSLVCPATLEGDAWACIAHARFLQGGQSFWKVIWRWGENYPNVVVRREGTRPPAFGLSYSPGVSTQNFASLW